ncbi:sensor histidine kinase [Hymenobacter sp. GOD-10R]|uniref:sensor histidine kinase n=1 Tax=Hymenobacter sp. GOD-10R TaxID=3093922 RepID=UPI002D7919A4|nr:histidine kinase [Hymenobacter sp. GOD-10R]WRQ31762.1 histidine kinase [Hymenobacter sp. GOD-10R]
MPYNRNQVNVIWQHLLIWVLYIVYEHSILIIAGQQQINYKEVIINFSLYGLLFYTNALLFLPLLYAKGKHLWYAISLILLLFIFCITKYFLNIFVLPVLTDESLHSFASSKLFWSQALYRGIYFTSLSFGYWFAVHAIQLERQKRLQEQKLRVAEHNLMQSEITFLRSQINPHFLFNTLNFLYAQAYPHSEETAKGILLLSNIMRYALKDEEHEGKVMLESELKHLENYIAINQLRFNNKLQVHYEVLGSVQFMMIIPLVLITFVENCFKHGDLSDPQNPLVIRLQMVENRLSFFTHNKKRTGPKEKTTGIGLVNTQKRLELAYANRYTLAVQDEPEFFSYKLVIEL